MNEDSRPTSSWDYVDFDLEIREGGPRNYPISVRSPVGTAQGEMHFPFDEQEIENRLLTLENAFLRSGDETRRRIPLAQEPTAQEFGQGLFEALLDGEVHTCYEASRDQARQQDKALRLKLCIRPPELAALPWEFLYDPDRAEYLCLSSKTPLVRYPDLPQAVEQLPVVGPLKILGMVASPRNLDPLNIEHEKQLMKKAVENLQTQALVELNWVEGQTWRDLMRGMRRGPWHIFHFIGHGSYDPKRGEGGVVLADEEGYAHFLSGRGLAQLLKEDFALRLVLLNSCEGATGSKRDIFSSTAATLIRPGIPAVLAMQYEVTDKAAIEFSRTFYQAIADGRPVEAAVANARLAIHLKNEDTLEWGAPVLYMRSRDGRIFDILTKEQEDTPRLYRQAVKAASVGRELTEDEARWLTDLANRVELRPDAAADIEREVLDDTKEAIFKSLPEPSEEPEPRRQLAELYAQARKFHRHQDWQAVVGVFDKIQARDPEYPDPEGLLVSAREASAALELARQKLTPETAIITPSNVKRIQLLSTLRSGRRNAHLVNSVAFSSNGQLLASGAADETGDHNKTVRLWRVEDGRLQRTLTGHTQEVAGVVFSPDGQLLASGAYDSEVRLWQVRGGKLHARLRRHRGNVFSVAFSPDGKLLASGADDRTVRLWRVADGNLVDTLEEHRGGVASVAFSPDGQLLASGAYDNEVRLWRVEDSSLLYPPLRGHRGSVFSVAFSSDGKLLASGADDRTVRLWRVRDGNLENTLERHTEVIESVAFSPDGQLLAAGVADRTVWLWGVEDGERLHKLEEHTGRVRSVTFSLDGRLLATGAHDETVRLWGVK